MNMSFPHMFRKPFAVKSNTQMRGSDRKKLKEKMKSQWKGITEEDISAVLPNRSDVAALKCSTWKDQPVNIYCCDKQPVAFELDNSLFPTVYTMWTIPGCFPQLVTHPPVISKLEGGADLMAPGIVFGGNPVDELPNLTVDSVCGVALMGNGAAVAVSKVLMSRQQLIDSGFKGAAVKIFHLYNDSLWEFGSRHLLPTQPCRLTREPNVSRVEEQLKPVDTGLPNSTIVGQSEETANVGVDSKSVEIVVDPLVNAEGEKPEEEDVNLALRRCFLMALKFKLKKGESLPLLANLFYANTLLPVISANLRSSEPFNMKKTKYKKVATFLTEMQSAGFIELKELSKGVQSVVAVNWSHPELESLRKRDFLEETANEQISPGGYRLPVIAELFSVTSVVATVLSTADSAIRRGSELSAKEVRDAVVKYVKGANLQTGRTVTLDPQLSDLVQTVTKTKPPPTQMSIDDLMATVLQGMTDCYAITYASGKVVRKKSKLPHITITVAQRAANKRVTLVNNLKLFDIDPAEMASRTQLGVASSASTHEDVHSEGPQVQIQGNQVAFVGKLLEEFYEIPKKWVDGMENAVKPKKK